MVSGTCSATTRSTDATRTFRRFKRQLQLQPQLEPQPQPESEPQPQPEPELELEPNAGVGPNMRAPTQRWKTFRCVPSPHLAHRCAERPPATVLSLASR